MNSLRNYNSLKLLLILLSLLCLVSLFPVYASRDGSGKTIRCIERERQALLSFRKGLTNFEELSASEDVLSSWGSEEDKKECCNWEGISCSNSSTDNHVIAIRIFRGPYNELKCKFSRALLDLQHLILLDLRHFSFEEKNFLEFIGSLKELQYLSLRYCDFPDVAVSHQLGNLTNLKSLEIFYNWGIEFKNLEWLPRLSSLTRLDFSLSNITDPNWLNEITKLPSLQELYLGFSYVPQITTPHVDIFVNSSSRPLSILDLTDTNLDSLSFRWLFNISKSLVNLQLSGNKMEGPIPEAFGSLVFLEYLDLSGNMFGGTIPRSLWALSHLHILLLSSNDLRAPMSDILNLPMERNVSLQILDLSNNQIPGSVPDLSAFISLKELHISNNMLKELPAASIQRIPRLELLDVSYNSIEGTIDETHLSQLHNLKVLNLAFNSLSVNLKPDWIPTFKLDVVKLACCKVGHAFPKWIRTQSNLSQLDLSSTGIIDVVPEWLWSLSSRFEYLNLSHNQIGGGLADLASNFKGFPNIDISVNNFSGPLPLIHPDSIMLQLSKNMFRGPISSICRVAYKYLAMLDMSDNQLSGDLPDCWVNMPRLYILNLANNLFSGEIPSSLCSNDRLATSDFRLATLHLRNNNLSGELPSNLGNCQSLRMMDVGENRLTGSIPSWLGTHLTGLHLLSLRDNNFYGDIPSNICHLQEIQILDLSRNSLSGKIPNCFKNFTSMVYKNISFESMFEPIHMAFTTGFSYELGSYTDNALVEWKGQESEYRKTAGYLKLIDLSSNKLQGSIPHDFCLLQGLISLNLSRNNLTGNVDPEIGEMALLECLDLSNNQISGKIPAGMANLNFLAVLDLSNNNLSGKIPLGTQLQGFNASTYAGNSELCGSPIRSCPGDDPHPSSVDHGKQEDSDEKDSIVGQGFYISMAIGFVVGLGSVIVTLLLNNPIYKIWLVPDVW